MHFYLKLRMLLKSTKKNLRTGFSESVSTESGVSGTSGTTGKYVELERGPQCVSALHYKCKWGNQSELRPSPLLFPLLLVVLDRAISRSSDFIGRSFANKGTLRRSAAPLEAGCRIFWTHAVQNTVQGWFESHSSYCAKLRRTHSCTSSSR